MPFRLIVVPYILGVEGESMGAGPLALQDPLAEALRPDRVERVKLVDRRSPRSVAASRSTGCWRRRWRTRRSTARSRSC